MLSAKCFHRLEKTIFSLSESMFHAHREGIVLLQHFQNGIGWTFGLPRKKSINEVSNHCFNIASLKNISCINLELLIKTNNDVIAFLIELPGNFQNIFIFSQFPNHAEIQLVNFANPGNAPQVVPEFLQLSMT